MARAQLTEADRRMRASGLCQRWLGAADAELVDVVGGINGPLLEQLLRQSEYEDIGCLDLLRKGARMTGRVDVSGGEHAALPTETKAVHDLMASCRYSNNCLWWELDRGVRVNGARSSVRPRKRMQREDVPAGQSASKTATSRRYYYTHAFRM